MREVDDEIRFHLEMEAEKNRRNGMSDDEARRTALRSFGGVQRVREEVRDLQRTRFIEDFFRDAAYAWRTLRKSPAFSATIIVTLGIAIALAAAIFTFIEGALLRPLPYTDLDRVVSIWESNLASGEDRLLVSPANFLDWQARSRSFEALGLLSPSGVDMQRGDRMVSLNTGRVDENFFRILGVTPIAGRLFDSSDFDPGAEPRVLLTYELWRDDFGADSSIVSRTIELDGKPAVVLGVLPPGVDYPSKVQIYSPLKLYPGEKSSRTGHWMTAVGKVRGDVSIEEARADMDRVAGSIAAENPATNKKLRVRLIPMKETLLGNTRRLLAALAAASTCLLLLACANAGALALARGAARRRELAIRSALGAGTARLVRQLVTESVLLTGAATAAASVVAIGIVRWMAANAPEELGRIGEVRAGVITVAIAMVVALVAVFLSGVLPATRLVRGGLARDLEASRRDSGPSPAEGRLQAVLVTVQIALALLLLTGAGLLTRSIQKLTANDLGFDPRGIATVQMFLYDLHPDVNERSQFVRTSLDSIRSLPGVVDAAATTALPFEPAQDARDEMEIAGRPPLAGESMTVKTTAVTPGYFGTMKIPVRGRDFTDADDRTSQRVALVNETAARRFWPARNPIGSTIRVGIMSRPYDWRIVGVVGDVRDTDYAERPGPEIYVPLAQSGTGGVTYIARTTGNAHDLVQLMQERVWELTPSQATAMADSMSRYVGRTLQTRNFALALMTSFGAVALIVSGIGLFGLLTYVTTRRRNEVGVRLALGATPSRIERLFLSRGLRLIAAGIAGGLILSLLSRGMLEAFLYETSSFDVVAVGSVVLMMALVGLLACWIPAHRVASLEPALTLREE